MKKRSFVYWGMFFILLSTLITPFLKLETGYAQTEPTSTSETNQISATPNVVPRKQVGNIVTAIQLTDKRETHLGPLINIQTSTSELSSTYRIIPLIVGIRV